MRRPDLLSLAAWSVVLAVANLLGMPSRHSVTLRPALCEASPTRQKQWLGPEWQPFLKYTRTCSIRDLYGKPVLLLISAWAELYYKDQPGGTVEQAKFPKPLLFLPSGARVGSLPFNFPDDPPTELRVTFTSWNGNFPHRIELYLKDPAALGDRSLPPQIWDAAQRKFIPATTAGRTKE